MQQIIDTHAHICDPAFDEDRNEVLERAGDEGIIFSIPPSVVRSRQKQKLVKKIPLSQILVETDSPVLGPDPNRRNEPANASTVIRAISELKNISEQEILEAVWNNTHKLYGNI